MRVGGLVVSRARAALWLVLVLSARGMIRNWYVWRISHAMTVVENRANPISKRLAAARRAYRLARYV